MTDKVPQDAAVPRMTVDWYRSTPWWRLVSHAIAISWRASHLLLCAAGLLATWFLTSIAFWLFQPEQVDAPERWVEPARNIPALAPFDRELSEVVQAMTGAEDNKSSASWYGRSPDSFLQVWRRYLQYPYQALESLTLRRAAYLLFCSLSVIGVWSFVGGCIARRSIQEFGTRITAPWSDTVRLVTSRWVSLAWSSAMPVALILMCCLIPLLLGWFSNIPYVGPWIAGLLMIPLVFLSLGLGWCAAVTLFGFPLSVAAIVSEKNADAFDGVSRAAAYSFQKPATLILAVIGAEWLGHFAGGMVSVAVNTGFSVLERAFNLGASQDLLGQGTLWEGLIAGFVPLIVTAFGFSFFWSASSAMYLVLRKEVDNTEFDLIDMDAPDLPKPLPTLPTAPNADSRSSPISSETSSTPPSSSPEPSAG
ncbi:MAG: hypothetical protein KGQ51_09415 [Planctomycetes bacterium]|nr:hypothetical protein [Planctomycetota bacterium]